MTSNKTNREVDILVAKKFLGLDVHVNSRGVATIGAPQYDDFAGDLRLQNPVPMYSEDIAAAWPLLEEISNKGWFWRLDSAQGGAKVIITIQNLERKTFMIESDTGAGAICEAALKIADELNTGKVITVSFKPKEPDGAA